MAMAFLSRRRPLTDADTKRTGAGAAGEVGTVVAVTGPLL
jgi:hypothetical protein